MSNTPDKCPKCGAGLIPGVSNQWICGSWIHIASGAGRATDLCRERAAHAETRKRIYEIELNIRMILNMGESIRVHEGGGPEDVHKSIVVTVESLRRKLTREREKWEKLRVWAKSPGYATPGIILSEMNRLDAEAKE